MISSECKNSKWSIFSTIYKYYNISSCLLICSYLWHYVLSTPSHYIENGVSTDLVVHIHTITYTLLVYTYVVCRKVTYIFRSKKQLRAAYTSILTPKVVVHYKYYILLHPINSSCSFFFFGQIDLAVQWWWVWSN